MPEAEQERRSDSKYFVIALAALIAVSLFGLGSAGLIGPDEPRYAAIGREMAASGDWITPRLWGAPWFEKPPLLYWMIAAAHRLGLHDELAARLPAALCGTAFVVFFWWSLRRLVLAREASLAALMLAASAGWMAVGNVAATDMPLAASFNGALLCTLLWLDARRMRWAVAAGVCLGLALLAKGLVGAALFLPLLWFARRELRGLLLLLATAAAVSMPWYSAITARHGMEFIRVFFLQHHFSRFVRPELQHVQPFWFYVPVLLGLVFPWTPLLALLRRSAFEPPAHRVFAAVAGFGFVFFSISTNKLPGYLLPLLPAVCVLLVKAVADAAAPRRALAACGFLLCLMPVAAAVLPEALQAGLRRASFVALPWIAVAAALLVAAAAWWLADRGRGVNAVALIALITAAGWLQIKLTALPAADGNVSARFLWSQVEPHRAETCVESINRGFRYSLNYYSVTPLPDCGAAPFAYRVTQAPGKPPCLAPTPPAR